MERLVRSPITITEVKEEKSISIEMLANRLVDQERQRDTVEKALINHFRGLVKPLALDDVEILNKFKDGSFGFSYLGIMLYANGYNFKGQSSKYPQGLLYYDGDNVFGLGFFRKTLDAKKGHLHIIAPRGKTWTTAVYNFINQVRHISDIPKTSIYIRHLSEANYKELIDSGYNYAPAQADPWHLTAHSEDETYNHRLIQLDHIIGYNDEGTLEIKTLQGDESKDFRRKAKLAYNRFTNFLDRNKLEFSLEPYDPYKQKEEAKNLVRTHFRSLKNAVGSTPEDYFNLVYKVPPSEQERKEFFAYLGYLRNENERIPITLFIGEKINFNTVAMYATFSLRDEKILPEKCDTTGFTAISQYAYLRVFDRLYKAGIDYVDLGGSEVEDLDRFKRQLGAKEVPTYWLVARE